MCLQLKFICSLSFLLLAFKPMCQEYEKDRAFKLYGNLNILHSKEVVEGFGTFENTATHISLGNPTFAYAFGKAAKGFHEIELSKLSLNYNDFTVTHTRNNPDSMVAIHGENQVHVNVGLRYGYSIKLLGRDSGSRFRGFAGVAIQPTFQYVQVKPKVSNRFPTTSMGIVNDFSFVPGIQYYLWEHFLLDLNIPVNLVEAVWDIQGADMQFETLPTEFLVRFGIAYQL